MHIISMSNSDNMKTFKCSVTALSVLPLTLKSYRELSVICLCLSWTSNGNQGGLPTLSCALHTATLRGRTNKTVWTCTWYVTFFLSVSNAVLLHHDSSTFWFPDMVLQFCLLSSPLLSSHSRMDLGTGKGSAAPFYSTFIFRWTQTVCKYPM